MADRSDSLTLIITGEVTFPRLLSAGQSFFRIVREVERGIGGTQKESVTWIVSAVKKNSLELRVTGRLVNPRGSVALIPSTVENVVKGIRTISRHAQRPPYFSERRARRDQGARKPSECKPEEWYQPDRVKQKSCRACRRTNWPQDHYCWYGHRQARRTNDSWPESILCI